jgi:translation initiation factor eIF-2B subunit delta
LITDAQINLFAPRADLALVGADALLEDGSVVNKAGTSLLALACHDNRVPFYVCAESFKKCPPGMDHIELEEMDQAELGHHLPFPITTRNIYFDITPARLITTWFNEESGKR